MKTFTTIIERTEQKYFVFLFGLCLVTLFFSSCALSARAAQIERYTGGVLVYADNTVGVPKYKIFTDGTGFGAEQSAAQVGTTTIEWVRVAASPTSNEWIIVTRDAADRIVAQVCVGINDGLSCGATTTISATAGTHGLRNFDVAYEQTSGDALLVYGTATADELRKIEYSGGAWVSDASITTTRTTGTVEWVELTSRNASDQIGVAYSDSNDDVSAYRWSGTAIGNEATAVITATAATTDVRKFDISFEGVSGDMIVAAPVSGAGTTALGHMTSAGTWTIVANTEPDNITAFIDLQEPNPADDEVAMVAHGTATTSNPSEGYALNGATPNTTTTGMVDGTVAVDTTTTVWAANYMMTSVAYQSSTYYAVGVFSDVTGADDINWWTMASTSVWTARTDNTRTRGTIRFTDLFDYPNTDKVLLLSSDANSDLWADTWDGATTSATAWTDVTSGGALELTLSSATTDVYDFAFRISPPAFGGVLYSDQGITNAGAGKLIKVAVGTSTPQVYSATTTTGGVWEFPNQVFTNATSGTPFVVWLDGDAEYANTLVSGYSGTPINGIPLYYEHVIIHGASTTAQVNALAFTFFDDSDDADIRYSASTSFFSVFGYFLINRGEFIAAPTLFADNSFANRGTFNANRGTVALHGQGNVDGILTGTSSFYTLSIQEGAVYTIATTSASTTNLLVTEDAELTVTQNLSVSGLFLNQGTFTHNTGTFQIGSASANLISALDVTGNNSGGTGNSNVNAIFVYEDYIYVTVDGNSTACSQVAGSAIGCELQIYNVTTGDYVAGRDLSGSATGTENSPGSALFVHNDILYWGRYAANTACAQTAGTAQGCEIVVFNVSDPSNPVFLSGIDHVGSKTGLWAPNTITSFSLSEDGGYLYTTKYNDGTACSQTPGSAAGCEMQVFDIASSTNLVYVAGRDSDGSATGGGFSTMFGSTIAGNYLYIARHGGSEACSDTPGDAIGCELQIYDISSPTNPLYVAGYDAGGLPDGDTGNTHYDVEVVGNTLYVAASAADYDCNGNIYSCELQVFNVTDPTNPILVAARDAGGTFAGTQAGPFTRLNAIGTHLYVTKLGDSTPCSQVAGGAQGCELQVYDISSTTNPVYILGRDADGTANGVSAANSVASAVSDRSVFIGTYGNATPCYQSAANATGCEVVGFQTTAIMEGNMTGNSAIYDVSVVGFGAAVLDPIETNDLLIGSSANFFADSTVAVAGDFIQNGSFRTNSAEESMWVQQEYPGNAFSSFRSVTYGNGLFVAVSQYNAERVATSPDGINWTVRSAAEDDDVWNSVTYGNGLFVAVAGGGDDRVMTSPDGITWTTRSAAGNNDEWQSITYGNGLFVAVGSGGSNDRVMTSPDGINWTVRTDAGGADNWNSVTYGNGLFVAVATFIGTRVMTSPDGENWTARSGPGDFSDWRSVTYGNGLFVAVGGGPVMSSPDGVTWTVHNAAGNDDTWQDVTYGNGLFVAVGEYDDDIVMTSPDGINWTARGAAGDNDYWYSVTYGNGLFVAVGWHASLMTSEESFPLSFTGSTAQTISGSFINSNHLPSVLFSGAGTKTFSNNASTTDVSVFSGSGTVTAPTHLSVLGSLSNEGTFVAGNTLYLSGKYANTGSMTAPTTFTLSGATQRVVGNMVGTSAFNNLVIAGTDRKSFLANASTTNITISSGADFEAPNTFSVTGNYTNNGTSSYKGVGWTAVDAIGHNWRAITYGGELFVAVGEGGSVMTSSNAINWTDYSAAEGDDTWRSVTYGNGLFVAVANEGDDRVMTSPDGITWTPRSAAGNNDEWRAVTYGNGLFVAVGEGGDDRVMTSPDGINWTVRSAAEDDDVWNSVTYGNGLFVAVAGDGDDRVMTSPDGTTWTARSAAGNNDNWQSITYGNGLFVAVAGGGDDRVMTSPDGITWTARSAAGDNDGWASITYAEEFFVAVGSKRVMTSPDGINWTERTPAGLGDNWQGVTYGNGLFVAVGIYIGERIMYSRRSTTEFGGAGAQSVNGNLNDTHSFGVLSVSNETGTTTFNSAVDADVLLLDAGTRVAFSAGATSTFHTVLINGVEGNETILRSTTPGTQFGFAITDTYSINYVDVKDSSGTSSTGAIEAVGYDSGNNTNWLLTPPEAIIFSSASPYHFYVGQATTTIGAITITETSNPIITEANDIFIYIDPAVTNFRFDQSVSELSFGGTVPVSNGVYYEGGGTTLIVDALADFDPLDTLVMNGIKVGSFAAATSGVGYLELHVGNAAGEPVAVDTQPIRITGSLAVANHPVGQVNNIFSFQNRNDETLYRFALTPSGENATITDMVLSLSGVHKLETSDITDIKLYRDTDNDGVLDGGDILVDGNGIFTINGQYGAITFSQDFVSTTTARYIVVADTVTIESGASAVFGIASNGITSIGATSLYSLVTLLTTDTVQHFRTGGGAGGTSARIGGAVVPGAGTVTGGSSGGGGGAGQQEDGVNIAPDPDFYKPTTTGSPNNEWTNGSNALLSDGTYATAASGGLRQAFAGFNFGIPTGNTIQGIAVKLDASGSTAAGTLDVSISWDGGNSFTTVKATPTLSGTDVVYDIGGNSDLWGRTWTASEFSTENFRLRVTGNPSSNTLRLDALEVRVYHQTGGGGSGGGSGGGRS